jgi:hypothetical protein
MQERPGPRARQGSPAAGRLTARGLVEHRPHERHTHVLELPSTDAGTELLGAMPTDSSGARAAHGTLAPVP